MKQITLTDLMISTVIAAALAALILNAMGVIPTHRQAETIQQAVIIDPTVKADLPPPDADCPKEGCGFIDFDANPELIGAGMVDEPVQ